MSKTRDLVKRRHRVVPRGVGQFAGDTTAVSAAGGRITDENGRVFIDLAGGIGVMNAGHCHPDIVAAIQRQCAELIHTCFHVATYEPYVALCEKLVDLIPHGEDTRVMLVNSGAEAVENAIKIARQATRRSAVLCYSEAFHGRTMMSMSLTSKVGYKHHCGPFAPEVYRIPYPNHFRYGDGLDEEAFIDREIQRLRDSFHSLVAADQLAAVIIEPVQGEGGFAVAPARYMQSLRRICDEHGVMLVCDEVQSGFCRTGRFASYDHAGITPDISTWAKSMGGGMPIGAVMGKADVMNAAEPGTLGGTYGGNPVAAAAALAAIGVMEKEDLNARAVAVGERVRGRLVALQGRCAQLASVRGLGAMIAAEFCHDHDPTKPATELVKAALATARDNGVLAIPAGPAGNMMRVLSPLNITDSDLDRGLDVLEHAILTHAPKMEKA